ncbi:MAG: c-type cytochrome [Phycisphaeraceae bacterium]|nr:c-type cytochrome [Phycisphaeraceae bacterium]
MDHEYDGIQEFDNPTPAWWHLIFLGSVVFAFVYFVHYDLNPTSWTIHDHHRVAQVRELQRMFAEIGTLKPDERTILTVARDPKWGAVAEGIFASNCRSCHGENGEGLVGPNLTDDAYKNVKVVTDIFKVINGGAANGAMPAWGVRLHPNEQILVASYVALLRGKRLTGLAPDGEVIAPWPEVGADAPSEAPADAPAEG